jgi:hypothetical protein
LLLVLSLWLLLRLLLQRLFLLLPAGLVPRIAFLFQRATRNAMPLKRGVPLPCTYFQPCQFRTGTQLLVLFNSFALVSESKWRESKSKRAHFFPFFAALFSFPFKNSPDLT